MKNRNRSIISLVIILVILLLTIGYSSFVDNLSITNSIAHVRLNKLVRITGVTTNSGLVNSLDYSVDCILSEVSLPVGNSITYNVDITNLGNVPVAITGVSFSDGTNSLSNITYNFTNYTENTKICDNNNECTSNISKTILITVTNNGNNPISSKLNIIFDIEEVYTITYQKLKNNNNYPTTILPGEALDITFDPIPNSVLVNGIESDNFDISTGRLLILNVNEDYIITPIYTETLSDIVEDIEIGGSISIIPISSDISEPIGTDADGKITTGYDANATGGGKYYLLNTEYLGSSSNNKISKTATFEKEDLSWEIWSKDDNKLTLISSSPTTSQLSLFGSIGYNNALYFMNDICDKLYGGGSTIDGLSARNIAMSDIEKKIMEYKQENGSVSFVDENGKADYDDETKVLGLRRMFNSSYASSSISTASGKKYVPAVHGQDTIINFYTNAEIRFLETPGYDVPTKNTSTARSTLTGTTLNYTISSLNSYVSSDILNMIKKGSNYWIATRILDASATSSTLLRYGFRIYNGTTISQNYFCNSENATCGSYQVVTHPLRPIIEIDLNKVNVNIDENGVISFE